MIYSNELLYVNWEGGEELNDFINHLENAEEIKHEKGTKDAIMELKSLIQKQRINSNSTKKTGTAGSLTDRITKLLIYGKEKKSETDQKIDKIKKTITDFAKQRKGKKQEKPKQYKNKRKEIQEQIKILKEKGNNGNIPWGEVWEFEDGGILWFSHGFRAKER